MNKILMRIEELCREKNISKYRLARDTNIPYTTIMNSFRNDTMPTISTLERICDGIGITMAQFFAESEEFPDLNEEQKYILSIWGHIPKAKQDRAIAYLEGMAEK